MTCSTLFVFIGLFLTVTRCQLLSVTLTNVVHISTGGDRVFATAGGAVYQYSFNDLSFQQQSEVLTGGSIVGLTTTPDGDWVIACVTNGVCNVISSTDLSIVNSAAMLYAFDGDFNGISLFTAPVSNGQSYYIGSYGSIDGQGFAQIRFNQRGFDGSSVVRDSRTTTSTFDGRHFNGGFVLSNFTYFIVLDDDSGTPFEQLRIVRVCLDNNVQSQYELQLACSASLFETIIKGVSVINEDTLIIGLTADTATKNRLCSFNITMINTMMDSVYQSCVVGGTGNTNVLWSVTSCSSNDIEDTPTEVRVIIIYQVFLILFHSRFSVILIKILVLQSLLLHQPVFILLIFH